MHGHRSDPARVARVTAALAAGELDPQRTLCALSAEVVGVSGAGLVLLSRTRSLGNVCVSDPVTEIVEDLQYTLGQGPCLDAFRSRTPVLVADLAAVDGRWSEFRQGAMAAGMRAAFGFPLMIGAVCIGALNLFHDHAGELTDDQYDDAVAVAQVASRTVITWQFSAAPDALAWQLDQVPTHRAVVHQATGMASVQAGVAVDDALVLLRAYAFAEDRPVGDIAADTVAGLLRFD